MPEILLEYLTGMRSITIMKFNLTNTFYIVDGKDWYALQEYIMEMYLNPKTRNTAMFLKETLAKAQKVSLESSYEYEEDKE